MLIPQDTQRNLTVIVGPDGREYVNREQALAAIARSLDAVEAVMARVPSRFAQVPEVRARLSEEIADALFEVREQLEARTSEAP